MSDDDLDVDTPSPGTRGCIATSTNASTVSAKPNPEFDLELHGSKIDDLVWGISLLSLFFHQHCVLRRLIVYPPSDCSTALTVNL